MLPSSLRLSAKEFKEVFDKGSRKNGSFFLCVSYNLGVQAKFAVVVPKKRAKKAAIRNRIRRRVYESIRAELATTKTKKESKVFILTKNAEDVLYASPSSLQEEVRNLL